MLYEIITAVAAIACLAVAADVARLLRDVIHPYFSPVKVVPGPDSAHWFFGNMRQVIDADPSEMHEQWEREYGPVVKYKTFMRLDRLSLMDVRAIGHILADPQCYQKPSQIRRALADILGDGLLSVEGDTHKRQRRVMSPAFGIPQIRAMTEEIFLKKSVEMRDIWLQKLKLNNFEKQPGAPHAGKIEVLSWLNRMTLDIIGSAGFGYDFGSLDETNTSGGELNSAVRTLLRPDPPSLFVILQSIFFVAKLIPTASRRKISEARATLERVGRQLLEEKKNNVRASIASNSAEKFAKKDFQDRDILTLLVRANMAADLPESSRMTDDEVLAQVPTFILAGHETTSTAVAWAIHALSLNLDVQHKLRAELLECVDGDRPSADTLNGLPYLDAVVRETMRVYSPAPNTIRVATQDDVIPTGKEWVDKNGVQRNDIRVSAGDSIFINILSINRSKEIWGEDAREFKPERWMSQLPSATSSVPGVYGNLLSFLGGNRSCIGWRFSVFEMKAIIYTLVRSFRFELAVSPGDIKMKQSAVTRPYIKDQLEAGPQLPVWVAPVDDGAE